jgi:hypothetical protein
MCSYALSRPKQRRRKPIIPRRSKNLQLSLFEDEAPRVVLAAAPMSDLAALVEALLREIATALANRETGDEQGHD